jgi:hypothetical protein
MCHPQTEHLWKRNRIMASTQLSGGVGQYTAGRIMLQWEAHRLAQFGAREDFIELRAWCGTNSPDVRCRIVRSLPNGSQRTDGVETGSDDGVGTSPVEEF